MVSKKSNTDNSSSKNERKEHRPRVSDINLMLSKHSRDFLKDFKVVLPPRLRSLIRHSLAGLSEESQLFVCGEIVTFLRCGVMHRSGFEQIDRCLGLLMLELTNSKSFINFPAF